MAVETILIDGVADALREVGLQFDRRHREAIEKQHEIDYIRLATHSLRYYFNKASLPFT
jgi:hypothetical protein